jgi:hypothetical protein
MVSKFRPAVRIALASTLCLLAITSMAQTTINVGPGQAYATIQSGINAASKGDVVLVAPGTYNENINFNGKAITVTTSGGPAATTINGGNRPGLATVTFANGETRSSVISGFTITGGGDTIFSGNSDGGVFVNGASPTIQGNTVTANYCHNIDVQFGAAAILNNEVSGVLAGTGSGVDLSYCTFGSGINLGGTSNYVNGLGSVIIGNTIENNNGREPAGIVGLTGAGIFIWAAQNVLIMNNIIRNNTAGFPGSAFASANSTGTVIVQNLIYGNTSCAGAIAPENGGNDPANPTILIANNVLADNLATEANASLSSCIAISQIYPGPFSYGSSGPGFVIVNNIVTGSTSYPAVNCDWFQSPSLSDQPTFGNNILYNAGGAFFGSYCIDVSNQDGNIAVDPQLVNPAAGNYQLRSASPAIDAGLNSVLQTFKAMTGMDWTGDFAGNPRVQSGSGKGCTIDMGAYEYQGSLNDCGVTETLTSSLNPAPAGQSVTFTAQLSDTSGTPTGSVQFLDGANPLGTQTVSSSGSASLSTSSLTVGSHTIQANYQPTGTFSPASASLTQVITGDATAVALTCAPNPIEIGGTAQLTATVSSTSGTPTGSVSFADNGSALATQALAAGAAVFSYSGSSARTHNITATYIPTGSFAASSASCSEVVNALPTISVLTVSPPSSTFGSQITLSAKVSAVVLPGPSIPTGTVTFLNGAAQIGSASLTAGVASLATSALAGGTYNLTCTYSGSSIYAASNCASVPVVVHPAPTALTLNSNSNPAIYGNSPTITASLTINGQLAGAGNTILLTINNQAISLTTNAAGSAAYSVSGSLAPGNYLVNAVFAATSNLLGSSASLTQVITAAPTSIVLTGTPNPGNINQSIALTATVSSKATSSTLVGSGSVSFYDGSTSLGTSQLSASGAAMLTAVFTTAGVHDLTAVFSGNADYLAGTSAVFPETIVAGDFSITATPTAASVYTGQAASTQVNVKSLNGFAQTLLLSCSGLPANATCTFSPATLPNGQGTAKLVIQTAAPDKTTRASLSALGALMLLAWPFWRQRRRGLAMWSAVLLALGITVGMSGCGSPNPITGGTPPGAYQVAVTASTTGTATTLTHSAVVTVTVKSLF